MPFRTDIRLNNLINKALSDTEIKKGITESKLDEDFLTEKIKERTDVWNVALELILTYDNTETLLANAEAEIKESKKHIPGEPRERPDLGGSWLYWTVIVLITLAIGWLIAENAVAIKIYHFIVAATWRIIIIGGLVLGLLFFYGTGLLSLNSFSVNFLRYRRKFRLEQIWQNFPLNITKIEEVGRLKSNLDGLEENINNLILDKSIKEILRAIINATLEPSYAILLGQIESPGLAEVIDPSRTINTSAQQHLDFMFKNMPGGSIGIAGPRGAGKSTLIQMYCGPKRSIEKIRHNRILPVMTSAPVEYEARDFILHLFSTTCTNFLKQEGIASSPPDIERLQHGSMASTPGSRYFFLRYFSSLSITIGIALIFLGLVFAAALSVYSEDSGTQKSEGEKKEQTLLTTNRTDSLKNSVPAQPAGPARTNQLVLRFIQNTGVTPAPLIAWGFILIGVHIIIRVTRRTITPVYANYSTMRDQEEKEYGKSKMKKEEPGVSEAYYWLRQIRFQQSFTSGWSGGLKLPVGLEGEINRAMTLAENQMTNPEIVAAFTSFLSVLPKNYQIIIGIDELDKIDSDASAHKFLNEIKSIFGIPRCFFLISVSENAMSNFERRGLPFRDVFDSAFDSIVYVDYLTLDNAKTLLQHRVIGKPVPFFCLSYCLSGGLPRDLIRSFRQVLKARWFDPNLNDLTKVTGYIIKEELVAKVRAVNFFIKKISFLSESDDFFWIIYNLQNDDLTDESVIRNISKLDAWYQLIASKKEIPENQIGLHQQLLALCEELYVFSYYLNTLYNIFNNSLDEQKLKQLETSGLLNELARSRQALSIDASVAKCILQDCRTKLQMPLLSKSSADL